MAEKSAKALQTVVGF